MALGFIFMTFDALGKGLTVSTFHGYLAEVQKCSESSSQVEIDASESLLIPTNTVKQLAADTRNQTVG